MSRKPVIAGNWKMYKTAADTTAFIEQFRPQVAATADLEIVICPPFLSIAPALEALRGSNIEIGGQNLYWEPEGAFTGEVSGPMLKAAGAAWVIIGHSERRQYFGETDATVFRKTVAALEVGLKPIVCVGELLAEREAGHTDAVLEWQFREGLGRLTPQQFARVVIAYEPVWAIGTGRTATPAIAQDAHAFLREQARAAFADDTVRILYGGSVKPENIDGLMAQPDIDGALVGGASLTAASFAAIVNF